MSLLRFLWNIEKYFIKRFWKWWVVYIVVIVAMFIIFNYIWQPCPHWIQDNGCWKDWGLSP